ncbi:YqjF family protein [Aneurinibacillus sp. REN35]|uniref:YqjF family protein n=1 Tax=Aneurinibacillus sp. REN35 TaxID=3237286 RepID=UPI00352913C3
MDILHVTQHRPFSLPTKPWVMTQTWNHLLFAHWPVSVSYIKEFIPSPLHVDTLDGFAWVGIVPFDMSHIRLRGLPPIPGTSSFPEINVRTYVTYDGKPGVFFFSLDAAHLLAVIAARKLLSLPYYRARIDVRLTAKEIIYHSHRIHRPSYPASFRAHYTPTSDVFYASPGSMEQWLTERYCLYTYDDRYIYRGDIHHTPWELQHAGADIVHSSMLAPLRFPLAKDQPILHYAKKKKVVIWPFVRVTTLA